MKRIVLILLPIFFFPLVSYANNIRFASNLLFRFDRQEFPRAPVPRETVDRYYIRWRPGVFLRLHPSLELGLEAEANWIDESDEDVAPPRFPEFHTPTFDRDNFKRDTVVLSRAFLQYTPSPHFSLIAGKFENPFLVTELVWDDDLHPNGAAVSYSYESENGSLKVTGRAGDFYASHYLHDRTNVLALQAVFQATAGIASFTGAVSYYDHEVDELAVPLLRTNTRVGGQLANDYNLIDLIGRVRLNLGLPLTAQIDYITNTAADTFVATVVGNGDQGYMVDIILGQLTDQTSFRTGFAYHHLESDAVLAAYNTDEWWLPTRGEGYRIHGSLRVARPLTLHASYLNQQLIGLELEFKRWLISAEFNWP